MRRTLLLLFLVAFSPLARSQEADKAEMQRFWETNIAAITKGDVEKVLAQSHFPLEITRGKRSVLTRDKFKLQYKTFFTPYVVEQFKSGSIDDIDAWTMEGDTGPTYMLVCSQSEETEAVFVFSFKQFDGKWKLYAINEYLE